MARGGERRASERSGGWSRCGLYALTAGPAVGARAPEEFTAFQPLSITTFIPFQLPEQSTDSVRVGGGGGGGGEGAGVEKQ